MPSAVQVPSRNQTAQFQRVVISAWIRGQVETEEFVEIQIHQPVHNFERHREVELDPSILKRFEAKGRKASGVVTGTDAALGAEPFGKVLLNTFNAYNVLVQMGVPHLSAAFVQVGQEGLAKI